MLKKFSVWLSVTIFSLSILGFLVSFTTTSLLKPSNIKRWTSDSGAYQSLGPIAINNAIEAQKKDGQSTSYPLSNPLVKNAAQSALSSDFYQKSTEQVINGSFDWLNKKEATPKFDIDLLAAKQTFVDSLGDSIKDRYNGLPSCSETVLPSTTDLLNINCKTEGLEIDQLVENQKLAVLNDESFLPNTTITADNIGGEGKESVFQKQSDAPKYFEAILWLPKLFAGVAIISGLAVLFLAESKRKGARKIGWRLLVVGLTFLLLVVIGAVGLAKLKTLAGNQGQNTMIHDYKDIIGKGIDSFQADSIKQSGLAGISSVFLGGVLLIGTRNKSSKPRPKKDRKEDSKTPVDTPVADPVPEISSNHRLAPRPKRARASESVPTAPLVQPQQKTRPPRRSNLIQ